jgi:acyl transferase domain-containing protein
VSIGSFGLGGANSHAVLDDALSYLRDNHVQGFHRSLDDRGLSIGSGVEPLTRVSAIGVTSTYPLLENREASEQLPRLLVWSAKDANALAQMVEKYERYYLSHIAGQRDKLRQLTYTLATRRTFLPWRSYAIVQGDNVSSSTPLHDFSLSSTKPTRLPTAASGAAWIFTGQGAQYMGMGLDLLRYPLFEQTLRKCDAFFKTFGCQWSLFGNS